MGRIVVRSSRESSWLDESRSLYRELFIELDAILKAIDRFFNTENLPIENQNLPTKNFHNELVVIRDAILRTLSILEVVIPESRKNAFWFRKFAETRFLSDHKRDYIMGSGEEPDDPESCIFMLYDSFINFKSIITDLVKSKKVGYISFVNMGDLIRREMRDNRHFNPFRTRINPEFDTIENNTITDIVKGIKDRKLKRSISMSFIFLFRLLRYLNCIDITTKRNISISCGLLILTLVRSEIRQLIKFFERELGKEHFSGVREIFQPLTFQFSIELKRVYHQELRNVLEMKTIRNLRGRIENSHGILKNLIEQSIVQIAEHFDPSIKGENIFITFITKLGQSMKLREDLYILHKMLTMFEENISVDTKRATIFDSLRNYMLYLESFTFKLLRYDDYEEFSRFFNDFLSEARNGSLSGADAKKLTDRVHNFRIFLETTLNQINNRTELQGRPIDTEKTNQLLRQYLQ